MEALKNRVGAFTEAILTMACTVLLAVALNKVSLNNEGSQPIGGAIFIAVANLTLSVCAFIILIVATMLKPLNHESFLDFLYRSSKLLVHVCAILQSVLAYMIVLIKLNFHHTVAHLVICILFIVFPVLWGIQSLKRTEKQDKDSYAEFHVELEQSLDILASVTSFLFQMLVAMSLESQESNGQDNSRGLRDPLLFTFIFCLLSTFFMLAGAVLPPIQFEDDVQRREKCVMLCKISQGLCLLLTIILTVVVPMVTKPCIDIEWAVLVVVFPWILVGAVFLLCWCRTGAGNVSSESECKLAPLGLTKAMFAGFLAVLIPSFSSGTVSGSTKAFLVVTSGVVISGLLWRFLTHFAPMEAALVAADTACLLTLLMVICAGISFVLVANDAFAQGNITCQTSCTSAAQIQDSILNCIRNNMTEFRGKNWTAVLSSVPC